MAKQEITYLWGERSLLINMGNRSSKRLRILYAFEFLFTAGLATIFFIQAVPFGHNYVHWVGCIGAGLLYFLAARRFLMRIVFSECILLDSQCIALVKKTIFSRQVRRYDWRLLGALHYEGIAAKTDHPLKGKCFDYFGFETQEQLIQTLHQDGNLYFDTPQGKLYFAAGVYSWDAEEMVQMMKMYMGTSLQLGPEWEQMLQAHEMDDASNTRNNNE
ncbi:MAG: hypothetical protein H7257_01945 [Taibaiella sp.]|nr:hypothetical protein [Taibaiella sp.]